MDARTEGVDLMICRNCGKNISDDSRFCEFCGTKVTGGSETDKSGRKRAVAKIIIMAVVIALIITAVGIFVYRYFDEKPEQAGDIKYSHGIETPDIERSYTAENGRICIKIPEITYDDGETETPDNCRIYMDGEKCKTDSGYTVIPERIRSDTCDLRLEWDRDGEEYYIETEITLESNASDDWRNALAEYVQNESEVENQEGYYLIYLDNNDIPELVEVGVSEANGTRIINYDKGKVNVTNLQRRGFTYVERGNALNNSDGNMGYYYDNIYSIVDGKLIKVAEGEYNSDTPDMRFEYIWNGEAVSEEEYKNNLYDIYDGSRAIEAPYSFDDLMSADEITEELIGAYDES